MNDAQNRPRSSSTVVLAAALAAHLPIAATATGAESEAALLEGPRLAGALREGGKVIFIRHASTEEDYRPDQRCDGELRDPADPERGRMA